MTVSLKILRGSLQDRRGNPAGGKVGIRSRRFTIGRAIDCQLRCSSPLVELHHCQISLDPDRIVIRDFSSKHGTFVNGTRVVDTACLFHGDTLRVGRLEFELIVEQPRSSVPPDTTWSPPSSRPAIVPMRDTVPESVAHRLENSSASLNPHYRLTAKSRGLVFPRQS